MKYIVFVWGVIGLLKDSRVFIATEQGTATLFSSSSWWTEYASNDIHFFFNFYIHIFPACLSPMYRCSLGLVSSFGSHRWCGGVLQRTNCCKHFKQMKSISGWLILTTFRFMWDNLTVNTVIYCHSRRSFRHCILWPHHKWWCNHHVELTSCSWSLCVFHLDKK